jgi:hypothetical protein
VYNKVNLDVPTAKKLECFAQDKDVTVSPPKSHNLTTLEVLADHRYTEELRPTAMMLDDDQSTKFK